MRKLGLMVAVVAVIAVVAAPVPAQFSMNSLSGGSNAPASALPPTVGFNQMLPKYNINQTMMTQGNSRTFNFSKLLPNFSFINNRWPLKTGTSQFPPGTFGKK